MVPIRLGVRRSDSFVSALGIVLENKTVLVSFKPRTAAASKDHNVLYASWKMSIEHSKQGPESNAPITWPYTCILLLYVPLCHSAIGLLMFKQEVARILNRHFPPIDE